MLAMEGMGYGCRDNGLTFALNAQMWTVELPILHFGDDSQKARYLPNMCSGEWIGAHVITEAEAEPEAAIIEAEPISDRADETDPGPSGSGRK